MILNANEYLNKFKCKFIPFKIQINKKPDQILSFDSIKIVDCPINLSKTNQKTQGAVGKYTDGLRLTFDLNCSDKIIAQITLTTDPSGKKIGHQDIVYYGPNDLIIRHSKQIIPTSSTIAHESFRFVEKVEGKKEDSLEIDEVDGNIIIASFSHRQYNDIIRTNLCSSLFTQPKNVKAYLYFPYRRTMDRSLALYPATIARFKEKLRLSSDCSEEEYNAKIKELQDYYGDDFHIYKDYVSDAITEDSMSNYPNCIHSFKLNEEGNNLLYNFKGKYIGCISYETSNSSSLVVVTDAEVEEKPCRFYTFFSRPNEEEAIRNSSEKDAKFVTVKTETGEELAFADGKNISTLSDEERKAAEASYAAFVEECITPYSDVQPINIDQFMQPKELSQEPR